MGLNTENFAAAAILLENGANDEELFTLDTSRVGLFEVGINASDTHPVSSNPVSVSGLLLPWKQCDHVQNQTVETVGFLYERNAILLQVFYILI